MDITLFWLDGQFIMEVDGRKTVLHPWVGKELEGLMENPRPWDQEKYFEKGYRKPEVLHYLEKIGEKNE